MTTANPSVRTGPFRGSMSVARQSYPAMWFTPVAGIIRKLPAFFAVVFLGSGALTLLLSLYENGAVSFIYLDDRVVWYHI